VLDLAVGLGVVRPVLDEVDLVGAHREGASVSSNFAPATKTSAASLSQVIRAGAPEGT
jgi:hypothetical protein